MSNEFYDRYHKWPRGFKKRLAEYYGFDSLRCVLCWSYVNVCIHHLELNTIRVGEEYKITYDDLSMFVPLCGSCHGKIEAIQGHYISKKPPIWHCMKEVCGKVKISHSTPEIP